MFGDKKKEPTEVYLANAKINREILPKFTRAQLSSYNGVDKPQLYVGIKGDIFDVSGNIQSYGPSKPYNKFVGKDAARLLGMNKLQLKEEDGDPTNTWDLSRLNEKQLKVVDEWVEFFKMRYPIVGTIEDK
ncbi:hypothetical protein KGF56_003522 [Candida oxycetoniae]|uniref:Cytochrome b5 heme-binding domain-containing protein n=1 Tax=Candida oxycetoniae TaxID=497107 RepID=A0AAI9SVX1_9ASCO|nr:uncharacterized protein KGF56_003522 [Candida oxycetoniae]KAI3403704.2 hypothetical protein KGF56_003522 [Candida oxycetoniae]